LLYSTTQLQNGVRVLSEKMPSIRSVTVGLWIAVGSRDEEDSMQGSSHFLEHLLFKGTATRNARDIAETFDAMGGDANAFSAKEYTCLYCKVIDEDLPGAMECLVDMLSRPQMRPDDVESERRVILEEIAMHEDSPDDLVHDLFTANLLGSHPLGREVMGTTETIWAVTRDQLAGFHDMHYLPRNLVVAAAGNVDHEALVELVQSAFSEDDRSSPARVLSSPVPAQRLVVADRKTEQTHIVLGGPGLPRDHPDRFSWGVLDTLLGGGMSSRLFQEIRETRGLAYAVYSYRNLFSETGLWGVYAGVTPPNAVEVVKIIQNELDRVVEEGISEAEVDRAKGHLKGAMVIGLEDPSSRMTRLGKSELLQTDILSIEQIMDRIDGVTLQDLNRVAGDLLNRESRTLAVIGPFTEDPFSDLL